MTRDDEFCFPRSGTWIMDKVDKLASYIEILEKLDEHGIDSLTKLDRDSLTIKTNLDDNHGQSRQT